MLAAAVPAAKPCRSFCSRTCSRCSWDVLCPVLDCHAESCFRDSDPVVVVQEWAGLAVSSKTETERGRKLSPCTRER